MNCLWQDIYRKASFEAMRFHIFNLVTYHLAIGGQHEQENQTSLVYC